MVRARGLARAGEQDAYLGALDALFGIDVTLPAASGAEAAGTGSLAS
jgi:glutamyl-tRNA reductase